MKQDRNMKEKPLYLLTMKALSAKNISRKVGKAK